MATLDWSKARRKKGGMDSLWYVEHVKQMEKLAKEVLKGPPSKRKDGLHWTRCGYCNLTVPWETMKLHYFKRHAQEKKKKE